MITACVYKPQFNCEFPEGKEYICYSDNECSAYMNAYYAAINERFKDRDKWGWWSEKIQVKYMNLWADHKNLQLLGRIEAERKKGKKIYVKIWTEVYNLECDLLNHGYSEGFMKDIK